MFDFYDARLPADVRAEFIEHGRSPALGLSTRPRVATIDVVANAAHSAICNAIFMNCSSR